MDGIRARHAVFVIGATNRPKSLDPALRRAGRLSRVIDIPLPDVEARVAILQLLTHRMPLDSVDLEEIALETEGYSGADLKGLCQQAAMASLTRPGSARTEVTARDFKQALTDETATIGARAEVVPGLVEFEVAVPRLTPASW